MHNQWKVALSTATLYAVFDIAFLLASAIIPVFGYIILHFHQAISLVFWVSKWAGYSNFLWNNNAGYISILIGSTFVFFLLGLLQGRFLFSRIELKSTRILIRIFAFIPTFFVTMYIGLIVMALTGSRID